MAKKIFGQPEKSPNPILIALISQFLSNHGFSATKRIFNTERQKRPQKNAVLTDTYGEKYTQGIPQLDEIFQSFIAKHDPKQSRASSDSEASSQDTSSASSDSDDISDSAEVVASSKTNGKSGKKKTTERVETKANTSSSSESSSSDSESTSGDSGEEEEVVKPKIEISKKSLKRKARSPSTSSSSSSSSSSTSRSSDSEASEGESRPAKRVKIEVKSPAEAESNSDSDGSSSPSSSSSSSSSESDDDTPTRSKPEVVRKSQKHDSGSSSDSDSNSSSSDSSSDHDLPENGKEMPQTGNVPRLAEASSDTSATVTGDVIPTSTSTLGERKHVGARATKLAELSATARDGDYISNTYVSYDYADRAYNDLSVTRGKGFTKEKNKKKRGSYRGGAIDTSGGKGFKFDD